MREFTLCYRRINFVNTHRVRNTHDSLKLKMLEALKQNQQAPVVQTLDSAIGRIKNYPADKYYRN